MNFFSTLRLVIFIAPCSESFKDVLWSLLGLQIKRKSFARSNRPFNEENLKESERLRKKQQILSNSQKTMTKDFAKRHPRVGLNMKETLSEPERPSNSKFRAAYLLRHSCFESLYLYKLSRLWKHVAIMNLKSREYQNIILSSKSLRHHTSQLSRELNKSWAKIYLKKSQKIIYRKFYEDLLQWSYDLLS